jgi:hypothetical protein
MNYEQFKKSVYLDFIQEVRVQRLSYIVKTKHVSQLTEQVPVEKMIEDFSKCPLIKEAFLNHYGWLVLIPK